MKNMLKHLMLNGLVTLAATAGLPALASGPISIVAPYPPGGGVDSLARSISPELGTALGSSIIVENRPGANGIIGTDFVAKAKPDGKTLLLGNIGPNAVNQSLYPKLPYDCIKDFAPIGLVAKTTHVLAVHPSIPVKTVAEFIEYAKKRPGQLSFASTGTGGSPHLAGELFQLMTGVKMVHVPYKGAAAANTDLLGGHVNATFTTLPSVLPHIKAGSLRALAVTSTSRSNALPDVPTMQEAGVAGYSMNTWYGLFAPAGSKKDIVDSLNKSVTAVLKDPAVAARLEGQGYEVDYSTPEEFAAYVSQEVEKWGEVVQKSKLTIN